MLILRRKEKKCHKTMKPPPFSIIKVEKMEIVKIRCNKCGKEISGLSKTQLKHLLKIHQMSRNCRR
jgi:hypothetical protein